MSGTRGRSTRTARARTAPNDVGPVLRRLREVGITGIAFGAFGEAPDDAHRLLKVIAVAGAEARWADAMDGNARAIDLRSLFFETRRKKAQTRRSKRQGNWGLVVVCFRGPLHPKHTKKCALRRAVARVHYPRDMPQAPSQGTTKGTTRGKRGFRITRTRVTHART